MHIVHVFFNGKRIRLLGKKPLLGVFLSTPSGGELVQMSAVGGFMRISLSKPEDWEQAGDGRAGEKRLHWTEKKHLTHLRDVVITKTSQYDNTIHKPRQSGEQASGTASTHNLLLPQDIFAWPWYVGVCNRYTTKYLLMLNHKGVILKIYFYLYAWHAPRLCRCMRRPEEGAEPLEAGVTGSCEPPDTNTVKPRPILGRSSRCSWLLSCLSAPALLWYEYNFTAGCRWKEIWVLTIWKCVSIFMYWFKLWLNVWFCRR